MYVRIYIVDRYIRTYEHVAEINAIRSHMCIYVDVRMLNNPETLKVRKQPV